MRNQFLISGPSVLRDGSVLFFTFWRAMATCYAMGIVLCIVLSPSYAIAQASNAPPQARAWSLDQPAQVLHNSTIEALAATQTAKGITVVGMRGAIVNIRDKVLQQARVPTRTTLTSVYFVSDKIGWVAGYDGVILHTQDSGATWQVQRQTYGSNQVILSLWFANAKEGYAIGMFGLVLYTEDGGANWQTKSLFPGQKFDRHLFAMSATVQGTWLISSEAGQILMSQDKGKIWRRIATPSQGSLWAMAHDRGHTIAVGLRGAMLYSADGGLNWRSVDSHTKASLTAAAFSPQGQLVVLGQEGAYLTSRDGGQSATLESSANSNAKSSAKRSNYTALAFDQAGQAQVFPD